MTSTVKMELFNGVFCDYLDVTCKPDSSFVSELTAWLQSRYPIIFSDSGDSLYKIGLGKLKLEQKNLFHRASASGGVLEQFREDGVFYDYLSLLASVPHKVTRLDAALDVLVDTPKILRSLENKYSDDKVSLSRKSLKVTRMYSCRESDNQLTGTWYVGHRSKARVTARVYDKQAHLLSLYSLDIGSRTRYELTFRKDLGCTLRDAAMPHSLFYHYASPALLEKPPGIAEWEPHGEGWEASPVDTSVDWVKFWSRFDASPEMDVLCRLAASFGDEGVEMAIKRIRARIASHVASD